MCVCDSGFSDDGNGNCVDKSGKLLYATGVELNGANGGMTASCQIVDINDPSQSCRCPDYGVEGMEVRHCAGGLVQGKPIICGGQHLNANPRIDAQDTCFELVPSLIGSQWIQTTSMTKGRSGASAVPFTPVDSDTEVLWVKFYRKLYKVK